MVKEIRLENFSDLAKVMEEAIVQSTESNDYYCEYVYLIGVDTIKKFEETYNIRFTNYPWKWADEKVKNLKIQGSAKFVYVGEIQIYADCRDWQTEEYKRPRFNMGHIQKVVEYKNQLLDTGCSYRDKTYRFYLFNDDTDLSQVKVYKPNKVGTLTDKKADAWLNALLEEKRIALNVKNENELKVKQFKNMLADLLKMPLSKFEENSNVFRMGIFEIKYQCDNKTGYTRVDVDFDICAKNADNKTYLTNVDRIKILANAGLLK